MDLECNSGGDYFFILQAGLHYSLDLLLLKDGESLHFGIPKLCPPKKKKEILPGMLFVFFGVYSC